eukprot:80449_1
MFKAFGFLATLLSGVAFGELGCDGGEFLEGDSGYVIIAGVCTGYMLNSTNSTFLFSIKATCTENEIYRHLYNHSGDCTGEAVSTTKECDDPATCDVTCGQGGCSYGKYRQYYTPNNCDGTTPSGYTGYMDAVYVMDYCVVTGQTTSYKATSPASGVIIVDNYINSADCSGVNQSVQSHGVEHSCDVSNPFPWTYAYDVTFGTATDTEEEDQDAAKISSFIPVVMIVFAASIFS